MQDPPLMQGLESQCVTVILQSLPRWPSVQLQLKPESVTCSNIADQQHEHI